MRKDNQIPEARLNIMVATRSMTRRKFWESTPKGSRTGDSKPEALPAKSSNVAETPPILQLPVELFLIIVKFVLDGDQPNFTICKTRDWKSLLSLSEAFPAFRTILNAANLCAAMFPPRSKSVSDIRAAECPGNLSYLEINLPPSDVRDQWLDWSKHLATATAEELCLTTVREQSYRTGRFESPLSWPPCLAFAKTKGLTLDSSMCLDLRVLEILHSLSLRNVTSLVFQGKIYRQHEYRDDHRDSMRPLNGERRIDRYPFGRTAPFLPNLKRLKYCVAWDARRTVYTPKWFFYLFLSDGVKLTHFELSFAFKAPHHALSKLDGRNIAHAECYRLFQEKLGEWQPSLETYVVGDELAPPFIPLDDSRRQIDLRLLVFKCHSLNGLASYMGCTVGRYMGNINSAWYHICTQYAWFRNCDCILLETRPGGSQIKDTSWWDWPAQNTIRSWNVRKQSSLRYFVVGNRVDGYQGIERDMGVPFQRAVEDDRLIWAYNIMTAEECAKILNERCSDICN